jgi:hypothetical protein
MKRKLSMSEVAQDAALWQRFAAHDCHLSPSLFNRLKVGTRVEKWFEAMADDQFNEMHAAALEQWKQANTASFQALTDAELSAEYNIPGEPVRPVNADTRAQVINDLVEGGLDYYRCNPLDILRDFPWFEVEA